MLTPGLIGLCIAGYCVVVLAARWAVARFLSNGPGDDVVYTLLWRLVRILTRLVHRVSYHGLELVPKTNRPGALIVVSNHTGSVDPLLIQAGCGFQIRWMMAGEMMGPGLDWLWKRLRLIAVDRLSRDTGPVREAIRHVQAGGVIGIFPEGRIVVPPRQIRPFADGVGLLIARTKAPVLLVWVSGTPDSNTMIGSITTPSHARVQFIDLIDFKGQRDAAAITQSLRERIAAASGWPINDNAMPPIEAAPAPFSI